MSDNLVTSSRITSNIHRSNGILTEKDLLNAYEYFGGVCPYSNTPIDTKDWHLEHIIPVKMGGTTDPWNCIPVCAPCNLSKGSKHLLDWWDLVHTKEEEYKLEKIFVYILQELNKPRNYQISTIEQEKINKLIQEEQNIEEQDEESLLIETDKKLDIFTFLYQLINHLKQNKEYIKGNIDEYITELQQTYNNNTQYERLDIELFKVQNELVLYLKELGVTNHYSIAYSFAHQITSIEETKKNINEIQEYLNTNNISDLLNKNPQILFMDINKFKHNFEYLINIVKIPRNIIIQKPTLLNEIQLAKEFYETCIKVNFDISNMTNSSFARGNLKQFITILKSKEYQEHPELFTSQVLVSSTPERIQTIIASKEFQEHPELFTSSVLTHSTPERIQAIIASKEFQEHPDLFTSTTLAHSTPERIREIIASKEFQEHPELFTSTTLAYSTPKRIREIIASKEFQEHPELFTSTTLAQSTPERIQAIIASKEFQEHPELFTSQVLAHSTLERIQAMIASKEFQEHPELFTSSVLARSAPERIQAIIASKEFQEHPELFTSEVLSRSTPEKISDILSMSEWKDDKYKHLLKPVIMTKPRERLSSNIKLAENYGIENYITVNYLRKSISQNYALINYLLDNNIPLIENGKINSIFAYEPSVILKKYGIDLKQLMETYPYEEGKDKNAVR